jgi:sec-independent protein translocase protein TatA
MEIVIIVFILVFLFGAKKIPELARGMGKGINEFKKGLSESLGEPGEKSEEEGKKNSGAE